MSYKVALLVLSNVCTKITVKGICKMQINANNIILHRLSSRSVHYLNRGDFILNATISPFSKQYFFINVVGILAFPVAIHLFIFESMAANAIISCRAESLGLRH